ncbi:hypothetical protein [Beijerinckia sp. L45]|uniref:hypothetical protein n=1 Tax=Beijerinckia sp. L45 TaxID=1641855 RepID=UPI00131AF2AC|nr:hypothetical protein [Beijerinckia sp. L45]
MISAIVFVSDAKRREASRERELLVRSLVWLVSAVVAGIVRDVTLAGPLELGLTDIADQSGCNIVEGEVEAERLRAAILASRGTRLLVLESGFQPMDGIIGELDSVARTIPPDASVRLLATPATTWQRLFPDQAATVGLFAPADRCRALREADFRQLVSGVKPKALFVTRASPIV